MLRMKDAVHESVVQTAGFLDMPEVAIADIVDFVCCGGPMKWLEVATEPDAIARALADHGLAPRPPPKAKPSPFGQLAFGFT
jgi:hypothetical protein